MAKITGFQYFWIWYVVLNKKNRKCLCTKTKQWIDKRFRFQMILSSKKNFWRMNYLTVSLQKSSEEVFIMKYGILDNNFWAWEYRKRSHNLFLLNKKSEDFTNLTFTLNFSTREVNIFLKKSVAAAISKLTFSCCLFDRKSFSRKEGQHLSSERV